ncbi:FkbM family methyltransferase [Candidatus Pelagibacter sp.]|nr:FkbM family methyltransferase [Candidatus Pelagibacter sp.]|tara:strand:+ start:4277 stop:4948 length:672 start_codon:yes stop_codon:yes gene_type:complete
MKFDIKDIIINFLNYFKLIRLLNYLINKKYQNFKKLELNKNSIVIDLGANIGLVSQLISDKHDCNIYCYEPNEYAYKELINRFKNNKKIHCFNSAVTEKTKEEKIYFHQNSKKNPLKWSTGTSLLSDKSNVNPLDFKIIDAIPIQDLLKKFDTIDLIKIDIEGYEYKILPEIIKNKKKIKKVICELHGNPITNKNKFLNEDYKKLVIKLKELNLYNSWFLEHF